MKRKKIIEIIRKGNYDEGYDAGIAMTDIYNIPLEKNHFSDFKKGISIDVDTSQPISALFPECGINVFWDSFNYFDKNEIKQKRIAEELFNQEVFCVPFIEEKFSKDYWKLLSYSIRLASDREEAEKFLKDYCRTDSLDELSGKVQYIYYGELPEDFECSHGLPKHLAFDTHLGIVSIPNDGLKCNSIRRFDTIQEFEKFQS